MIGIIGAMEEEVTLLRSCLEGPQTLTAGSFEFIRGKLEGKQAVLLRCGIGKVNAAVGTALLIHIYKPSLVINSGCAGGIKRDLRLGDVIVSSGLLYHDVDVTAFDYLPGQLPGHPQIFPVNESLITSAEEAIDNLKKEKILSSDLQHCRGLIGSGDTFVCKNESIALIRRHFPEIAAVEMEGAAIAHTCHLFSVPALVIRALSDIAGVESPVKFEEFLPIAAKNSAEIVRRIVRQMRNEQ